MIIVTAWWALFLSYKYQEINVVYIFLKGNDDLNIFFPVVVLILQNYIQRNKLHHGIWNMYTVLGTKSTNFCRCTD